MIFNVLILACHDIAVAFRNKSIFVLVFVPLLVGLAFRVTEDQVGGRHPSHIALIYGESYPEEMISSLPAMRKIMKVDWIDSADIAPSKLRDKTFDGVLLTNNTVPPRVELLVHRKHAVTTVTIIENIAAIQRGREGQSPNWIAGVTAIRKETRLAETIPTWVLMNLLLVGLLMIPAQVAGEKEGKQLLGILMTPAHEAEWLGAKLIMGVSLSLFSVFLLHIFCQQNVANLFSYLVFLSVGSLYFSSIGILLGSLCETQASARALGICFYIPHLLPPALADFSQKMAAIASFIPSIQFYLPIKSILIDDSQAMLFLPESLYLTAGATIALISSMILIRRRWLM